VSADGFVSAELDLSDVEDGLRALARAGRNLAPAFRALKPEMRLDQREHALLREGPESKWKPLAATTLAEYSKRGKRRPTRPLGRLLTAVQYVATSSSVMAKSLVSWSGVHQEGGVGNHGARIPAREFLWISTKFLAQAESMMTKRLLDAYGGG
jgi:phage gpG-like protein